MSIKQTILTLVFLTVAFFSYSQNETNFVEYSDGNKIGFKNAKGDIIIPAKYDERKLISNEIVAVKSENKWDLIDKDGKKINSEQYDYIKNLYGTGELVGLFIGVFEDFNPQDGKYGFFNTKTKKIIPCKYNSIWEFTNDNLLLVFIGETNNGMAKKGKYGFVNTNGAEVIPCKYDNATKFNNGLAKVFIGETDGLSRAEKGKYGFINKEGKEIIPLKYDFISDFMGKIALAKLDNKWGFINTDNKTVVDFKYDKAWEISKSLIKIFIGKIDESGEPQKGKYILVDRTGKEINSNKYDYVGKLKSYFVTFAKVFIGETDEDGSPLKGKYGFVNKEGKEITSCKYDYVEDPNDDLAKVFIGELDEYGSPKKGKYGFVNKEGKEIISCKYDEIGYFEDGKYKVKINEEEFYINKKGEKVN